MQISYEERWLAIWLYIHIHRSLSENTGLFPKTQVSFRKHRSLSTFHKYNFHIRRDGWLYVFIFIYTGLFPKTQVSFQKHRSLSTFHKYNFHIRRDGWLYVFYDTSFKGESCHLWMNLSRSHTSTGIMAHVNTRSI